LERTNQSIVSIGVKCGQEILLLIHLSEGGDTVTNEAPSTKKTILVADDEPSILYAVRRVLAGKYTVIEACDGEQAVVLAQQHKPDVILMDMMMPKKDGLTACSLIRAGESTRSIPVLMLSGVGHDLNKKLAATMGANGYVTKPFKPQELLDAIGGF
jgi:CheY-like chemotaxis protein